MKETTLVVLKPPSLSCGLVGGAIGMLEDSGLRVSHIRCKQLTHDEVVRMYPHVATRDFFPEMSKLYTSEKCVALFISGTEAIQKTRAVALRIRNLMANKQVSFDNRIHASDSLEAFNRERIIFE